MASYSCSPTKINIISKKRKMLIKSTEFFENISPY